MHSMCWLLQHHLSSKKLRQQELLELCMHFFNYRTRTVGFNQIQSVYNQDHTLTVLDEHISYYYQLHCNTVH